MVALDARVVVLGLRIAQACLAIVVLGLTAYGMLANTRTSNVRSADVDSRKLVGQLLARYEPRTDQFSPLRLSLDDPGTRIPHHRAMEILRDEGTSQVRHTWS